MRERYQVVLVDDQEQNLNQLSEVYENEGYDLNIATNYDQLLFCLEEELPDLIVINFKNDDIKMKDLYLRLREDDRFFSIEVLGLFESKNEKIIDNYLDLGVACTCAAPYSKRELLHMTEQLTTFVDIRKNKERFEVEIGSRAEELRELNQKIKEQERVVEDLREQIAKVSVIDNLTGLYNRNYAIDQLEMAISRFNRKGIETGFLLCDIDNFNEINASYGHQVGDRILYETGQIIIGNKRQQDVVARYSGNTYMIILPDTEIEGSKYFAERARKNIEKYLPSIKGLQVTVTIGLSVYNRFMPFDMFIKMTEDALRFGKDAGKNKVITSNDMLDL
ncbi:MAG: diguanylate cyclase [Vallitaleaceae bacterium]|nr:diguanylate cyclase [Vallitaleaceae bacterium]